MLGCGVLLAVCDWWWRSEVPLLRWTLSLTFLMAIVAVVLRLVRPAVYRREDPVALASQLEPRFTQGRQGELAAGVSLVLTSNARQSSALAEQVLRETWEKLKSLSPRQVIGWERLGGPMLLAMLAVGGMVGLSLAMPAHVGVGTMRLLNPVGSYRWPTRYDFAFRDFPGLTAAGRTTELVVFNRRGRTPSELTLYWESVDPELDGGRLVASADQGEFRFELPPLAGDIRVRAAVGDSDTGWRRLRVQQPPRLESWIVTALPPPCLGLPARNVGTNALVPSGAELTAIGLVAPPVGRAEIVVRDARDIETRIPLIVTAAGGRIETRSPTDWLCADDCSYWVELEGLDGLLTRSETAELTAVGNPSPRIVWTDEELRVNDAIWVTATGSWPVLLSVGDDQGWSEARIEVATASANQAGQPDPDWQVIWRRRANEAPEVSRSSGDESLSALLETSRIEQLLGDSPDILIRAVAVDECGESSNTPRLRARIVTDSEYAAATSQQFETWRTGIAEWTQGIDDLRRQAHSLRDTWVTTAALPSLELRVAAMSRVGRWTDQVSEGNGSFPRQLERLARLIDRQRVVDPGLSERLALAEAALNDLAPRLARQRKRYEQLQELGVESSTSEASSNAGDDTDTARGRLPSSCSTRF
ncbi:MAG: hypothetical protein R3B96_08255 [Pirellulaceae bacterium]